ncbi:uncharacterized protein LAESUDRAFT_757467 [Laetiporus sulphureus 93-53]|uniref:Metalloenzyme domain-containing protein n=1 Tax=Laetiporus sulphureus 93-53 TaxID=1314785 RepID=A0A165FCA4_9APHY|nr:uncharacterized protein LAESUDRAFT_757467 [Laetiporus sulphureus 93-53]KZT08753.1 hypothetical protein LAESUDRAFT_757467 [Laetiporus sulphureus 93-53]
MSATDANPVLPLLPSSLYVTLSTLLQKGSFHWSLWITDAAGRATRHHWAERKGRREANEPVEEYTTRVVPVVFTFTGTNSMILALIKIAGYNPPDNAFDFVGHFKTVFPDTYTDIRSNRRNGTSCRTWAMKALTLLQEKGIVIRPGPVAQVEQARGSDGEILRETMNAPHWVASPTATSDAYSTWETPDGAVLARQHPLAIVVQDGHSVLHKFVTSRRPQQNTALIAYYVVAKSLYFAFAPKQGLLKVGEKQLRRVHEPPLKVHRQASTDCQLLPTWLRDALELFLPVRGIRWDFGRGVYVPPSTRSSARGTFNLIQTALSFLKQFLIFDLCDALLKLVPSADTLEGGTIFLQHLPPAQRYAISTARQLLGGNDLLSLFAVGLCGSEPAAWPPLYDSHCGRRRSRTSGEDAGTSCCVTPSSSLVDVPKDLHHVTIPPFPLPVAFPPQPMTNVLAEWLAKQGVYQAYIAENVKNARVTFFNGGVEKLYHNEQHMIPSPKIATYDKDPKMSVIRKGNKKFVMCNFAPPDMVGNTGVSEAAVEAITATDKAVGTVYKAYDLPRRVCRTRHTAHTMNPLPFIMAGDPKKFHFTVDKKDGEETEGALCDVAGTVLDIMGLPKPEGEDERSLVARA